MKLVYKIGAFCALALVAQAAMVRSVGAQTQFYQASPDELDGLPGTLIRQEQMSGAPLDATAYRVLYRSKGLNDQPIATSGWSSSLQAGCRPKADRLSPLGRIQPPASFPIVRHLWLSSFSNKSRA
jgi:hypothetical protein